MHRNDEFYSSKTVFLTKLSANSKRSVKSIFPIHPLSYWTKPPALWNFILFRIHNHKYTIWQKTMYSNEIKICKKSGGKKRRKAKKTCIMLYSLHQNQFDISSKQELLDFLLFHFQLRCFSSSATIQTGRVQQQATCDSTGEYLKLLGLAWM